MTRIEITAKSVYGETKFYPANEAARHLAMIANTTTLTPHALKHAKAMGCEIVLNGDRTISNLLAA